MADGIDAVLPGWVASCVERVMLAWSGQIPDSVAAEARAAGERARQEVGGKVRALLMSDIDSQSTTPLALLRAAVSYPTGVLRARGVPAVERDRFLADRFPEDPYALTPASFADVDTSLAEPGIEWGAAKAFEHKRRHGGGAGA